MATLRAFGAAALKEWRVIRRYPTLIIGMAFWPIILPAVYVLQGQAFHGGDPRALEAFAARTGTTELAGFVFVGWAMFMWLSLVLWGPGTSLRQEQVRGSLEAVFATPASRLVLIFGPSTAYLLLALWQFVVMGLALRLGFGVELELAALARAFLVAALTVPAMYGIGSFFATWVLRHGEVSGLVQVVRGVFTVFCGVTYPILMLPEWAQRIALALPPTYFVADVRLVLLAGADMARVLPGVATLVVLGVASCALAVLAFRYMEREARRAGMLARY